MKSRNLYADDGKGLDRRGSAWRVRRVEKAGDLTTSGYGHIVNGVGDRRLINLGLSSAYWNGMANATMSGRARFRIEKVMIRMKKEGEQRAEG
jgi:hypothetical protein